MVIGKMLAYPNFGVKESQITIMSLKIHCIYITHTIYNHSSYVWNFKAHQNISINKFNTKCTFITIAVVNKPY